MPILIGVVFAVAIIGIMFSAGASFFGNHLVLVALTSLVGAYFGAITVRSRLGTLVSFVIMFTTISVALIGHYIVRPVVFNAAQNELGRLDRVISKVSLGRDGTPSSRSDFSTGAVELFISYREARVGERIEAVIGPGWRQAGVRGVYVGNRDECGAWELKRDAGILSCGFIFKGPGKWHYEVNFNDYNNRYINFTVN